MEALKAFLSIIICIALLAAEGIAMGLFSLERALSDDAIGETIRTTMAGTDITSQLVDEALAQSSISADSHYGEVAKAVLETDAMTGFFAGHLADAVNEEINGEPAEKVTEEELQEVFSQGIDEVNDAGIYSVSEEEEKALTKAMEAEVPKLMEKLSKHSGEHGTAIAELSEEIMGEEMGLLNDLRKYMDEGTRTKVMIGCGVLALALIALNWRNRFGFFWCGLVTAVAAALYWGLAYVGAEKIITYMLHTSYLQEAALAMITSGMKDVALVGTLVAVACIIAFAVLKGMDRRRYGAE